MVNYISRNMKYGNEVVGIVDMHKEVRSTYEANHMSRDLTIEDNQYEVKVQTQNQRIRMYVMKKMEMVNNIDYIYAKIWGQYTDTLQNMIKQLDELNMRHKEKDLIWLLKNLNTVSTWIYYLGDKLVNYFNSLKYFVNTRQGPLEGDEGYTKRARLAIETLILDGGRHVLFSPEIIKSADQVKPPEKETSSEEDKFSAICLL